MGETIYDIRVSHVKIGKGSVWFANQSLANGGPKISAILWSKYIFWFDENRGSIGKANAMSRLKTIGSVSSDFFVKINLLFSIKINQILYTILKYKD